MEKKDQNELKGLHKGCQKRTYHSLNKLIHHIGIAWCLLNGSKNSSAGQHLSTRNALQDEVLACLHALKWSCFHGIHYLHIYTNSSALIHLLKAPTPHLLPLFWTIKDLHQLGALFERCLGMKFSRAQVNLDVANVEKHTIFSFFFVHGDYKDTIKR